MLIYEYNEKPFHFPVILHQNLRPNRREKIYKQLEEEFN